jgi:subtilisin family serine protease
MPNEKENYYYVGDKKIKLNEVPDSFALRYKEDISPRRIERKLLDQPGLAETEERKSMPTNRLVIVTLPHTRGLADVKDTLKNLEGDNDVEFVVPVFREPKSGLRVIVADEIIVKFKSDISREQIDNFNVKNGTEIAEKDPFVPNQYTLKVKNPRDTLAIANKYHESDLTEFAEPNFFSELRKSNIPYFEQWHLCNNGQDGGLAGEDVKALAAWELTKGSPNITVAIIDDGVDIDHPDLKPNIWTNPDGTKTDVHGWDFASNTDNPRPQAFAPPYEDSKKNDIHGTACAGVVAASGDGALGVAGIACRCRILPVKISKGEEMPDAKKIAQAIRYAGKNADIISISWDCVEKNDIENAIKEVVRTGRAGKGCPVFAATGNKAESYVYYPASIPEAIAVGASTNLGDRAYYSNYGEGIAFVAPSHGGTKMIFTTDVSIPGRGYNTGKIGSGDAEGLYTNSFGGTSSSTPLAAGVAALILSLNPNLTADQVRRYMCETADKIDPENGDYVNGYSLYYGYGRINAYEALKAARDNIGDIPQPIQAIDRDASPRVPIPDGDLDGIVSEIQIDEDLTISSVESVTIDISHTYPSDLMVSLISPDGTVISLYEGQGIVGDELVKTYGPNDAPALKQLEEKSVRGKWLLRTVDRYAGDTGTLKSWRLKFKVKANP